VPRSRTTRNSRRLTIAALLAAGVAAVVPGPAAAAVHRHGRHHTKPVVKPVAQSAAACVDTDAPVGSISVAAMRIAVDCLINQQRTSRGLPVLAEQAQLERSAQNWNNWMINNNQFTHGTDFSSRIALTGYLWQTAGENIATGYTTANDVVTAWMASPDHCHNILDPQFSDVGTGLSVTGISSISGGPGTWTQDFGLKLIQKAPSRNWAPDNGCPYSSA
jgi:uncharacterized protein YkwD